MFILEKFKNKCTKKILKDKISVYFELYWDWIFLTKCHKGLLNCNILLLRDNLAEEKRKDKSDQKKIDKIAEEIAKAESMQNLFKRTEITMAEVKEQIETIIKWKNKN